MLKVSVIIPCFNQGEFVSDAVESVLNQSFDDFEIIIVDDGSTDSATKEILERRRFPKTRLVSTSNQGLSAARNNGISVAKGNYILPLDADDRIGSNYLEMASAVLDERMEVGFVYCLAKLFGSAHGMFYLNSATLKDMLLDSRVFCSAMFRKSDWEVVGGYKSNMVHGWEDWDFWLSLMELGKQPYQIPEVLFHYRVKKKSMIRSMTPEQRLAMHVQLFENHKELYSSNMRLIFEDYYNVRNSWYGKLSELKRKIVFNMKYFRR